MTIAEEHDLVRAAQRGDTIAVGELWDAFSPRLYGYLVNVLRDTHVAEDVFQSTWLKVLENLSRYTPRSTSFSAWLFVIAKNECRQHWRKQHPVSLGDEGAIEPSADERGRLNDGLMLDQVLSQLSEDDREVLRLRYIADLSTSDIAKALNVNFVAARVRLSRALARAKTLANKQH